MNDFKRGDVLKLSQEGLDHIYKYDPKGREKASKWRFEYRCRTRRDRDCLTVLQLPKRYHRRYHETFLERATQ